MARVFAQMKLSIWTDDDFLDLDPEQRVFLIALFSHSEVDNCGVSPWRPDEMTDLISRSATAQDVIRVGAALVDRKYLVIDEGTREVLVRSYIRHDGILKMPKMITNMVAAFHAVRSRVIRQAIANELHRLVAEAYELPEEARPAGLRNAKSAPLLLDLLRTNPATVAPAKLAAWAAYNPHRAPVRCPGDDFTVPVTEASGTVGWDGATATPTPLADTPADQGRNGIGKGIGKGIGNPSGESMPMGTGKGFPTTTATETREKDLLRLAPRDTHPAPLDDLSSMPVSVSETGTNRLDETTPAGQAETDPFDVVAIDGGLPLPVSPVPAAGKTSRRRKTGGLSGVTRSQEPRSEADSSYDDQFEQFWAAYGRKGSKPLSAVEFHWALERTDFDTIMAAVGPYVAAKSGDQAQYRLDAERWLVRDKWTEDPDIYQPRQSTRTGPDRLREWTDAQANAAYAVGL